MPSCRPHAHPPVRRFSGSGTVPGRLRGSVLMRRAAVQTLIAYAIAARAAAPVEDGCRRVERAYDGRWQESPVRHLHNAPHGGLILWEGGRFSRWPAWSATGARSVASLYAPVGYERVVQAEPLATAPTRLATELDRCPSGMDEILPPFVLGSLDEDGDRLRLTTDSLGIGRLFECAPGGGGSGAIDRKPPWRSPESRTGWMRSRGRTTPWRMRSSDTAPRTRGSVWSMPARPSPGTGMPSGSRQSLGIR